MRTAWASGSRLDIMGLVALNRNLLDRDHLLPGAELVERGLRDLERRAETVESLLVSLGAPGLRSLGLPVPQPIADAELRLYRLLQAEYGAGAHARYNSLVRRMVSFRRAAACAK